MNPDIGKRGVATQWKKGQSGNPGGLTKEARDAYIKSAEISAKLRLKALEALEQQIDAPNADAAAIVVDQGVMQLMRDAENRALGTPKQSAEISGPDGGPIETRETGRAKLGQFLDAISGRTAGTPTE